VDLEAMGTYVQLHKEFRVLREKRSGELRG